MIPLKFLRCRLLPVAMLALALSSCARIESRPATGGGAEGQAAREATLALRPDWSFSGRVAIDNAGQAGNARIAWLQRGDDFDITLSAPVTRQSWRLVREAGRARLEGLEGGVRQGDDAEALLRDATGWRIPVASLADWVRGRRTSATAATVEYGPSGLLSVLSEAGWTVEYRAWGDGQPPLPTRLFARQGQASVRLAVEHWDVP
jgi:outer membrane lipoprotein LolB